MVDGKVALKQEIATFINLAKEFTQLLREGAEQDSRELLLRLSRLLSQLYVAGSSLPIVPHALDSLVEELADRLEYEMGRFRQVKLQEHWPIFDTFEKYYGIDGPYGSTDDYENRITIEERNLSKDLWELYNILSIGLAAFDLNGKHLERLLGAVAFWRFEFDGVRGWGYRILQVLSALHQALEIQQIERRIRAK